MFSLASNIRTITEAWIEPEMTRRVEEEMTRMVKEEDEDPEMDISEQCNFPLSYRASLL